MWISVATACTGFLRSTGDDAPRWVELPLEVVSASPALDGPATQALLVDWLAGKKRVPPSPGTFPVTTPLFAVLLVSVVLIVGALTFFPALSLGPILEHLMMGQGRTF